MSRLANIKPKDAVKAFEKAGSDKNVNMQISYDPIADAMYIALTKKNKSTLTEPVREDFLVDFNKGKPVGIEILDVSHKIPKRELENITL